MQRILQSLGATLMAGFVLLVAVLVLAGLWSGQFVRPDVTWARFALRWLHVLAGLMWVGLLYYFNFVQMPALARMPDEHKPGVTKLIAPAALFWFRWAALATVLTGIAVAESNGYLGPALLLAPGAVAIGIGMWLALVMAFNVWFVIWPNQKRALGLVPAAPEAKARAARVAMLTSRANTVLSIPMLYCMVAQSHGGL